MTKKIQITIELDCVEQDESIDSMLIQRWLKNYIRCCLNQSVKNHLIDIHFDIDMSDDGDYSIVNEYKIIGIE